MQSQWLWLAGSVLLWSVACGDDEAASTTTSNGGSSATGGSMVVTTTGPTTSSVGGDPSNGGHGGAPGNPCEQACAKVDMCAGFPGACGVIGVDCMDPMANCPAACINAADCPALLSLLGTSPDPTLATCIDDCNLGAGGGGGDTGSPVQCALCTFQNCQSQSQACNGEPDCQDYVQCVAACSTPACEADCLVAHPSTESSELSSCVCGNCVSQCATCE